MTLWERIEALLAAASEKTLGALMKAIKERKRRKDAAIFSIALIALSAKMAKADGVVTEEEIEAFQAFFSYPPEEADKVHMIYRLAQEDVAGFDMYANQIGRLFKDEPGVLEDVLDCLYHIALADGIAHPAELALLEQAVRAFKLSPAAWRRVRAAHLGLDKEDPYAILGLTAGVSDDELKSTYRDLAKQNHPDMLIARGVPKELIKIAEGRMAAITEAYDKAVKERLAS
ncbi:MAG: TerB family tellurite resistance protein [bacterium]